MRATHRPHQVVRVLGSADAATGMHPPDESIDDLVRRTAAAGIRVLLRRNGPEPEWSPMTRQAAHRVVQESLTNAARHAPGAAVTITVTRQRACTRIDVVNDAPSGCGDGEGTGQGLIGLHERVRLVGGPLDAGPRPDGGWAVTAELPDRAGPRGRGDRLSGAEAGGRERSAWRRLPWTATLPLGIGLALAAGLVVAHVVAVAWTGLPDDRYDQLRLGLSQAQVRPLLPSHGIGTVAPVLAAPPRPDGATCAYYQAGTNLAQVDPGYYRICFAADVLVSKDRLNRA